MDRTVYGEERQDGGKHSPISENRTQAIGRVQIQQGLEQGGSVKGCPKSFAIGQNHHTIYRATAAIVQERDDFFLIGGCDIKAIVPAFFDKEAVASSRPLGRG